MGLWYKFKITASLANEVKINNKICNKGTKVIVWMISRFGDVGITNNLVDANGYDIRLDISNLENFEFIRK